MTDEDGVRHLFTAAEAERLFKIPASTIANWYRREKLWHYGIDPRGNRLYDRKDLLRLRDNVQTRDQAAQARRAARNARHRDRRQRSHGAD